MKQFAWIRSMNAFSRFLIFFGLASGVLLIVVLSTHATAATNPSQNNNALWAASDWQSTGTQPRISAQERDFLVNLSIHIDNEAVSGRIKSIISRLDTSYKLEQADYEFLIRLADKLNGSKIGGMIMQIAQKYHPEP